MTNVRIAPSKTGLGVFACREIRAGEKVLAFRGPMVRKHELPSPYLEDKHLQVGPDLYLGPSGEADDFVNHSCDPNCRVKIDLPEVYLVSLRPVREGEELTFDYSSTMEADEWTLSCRCGTARCRGVVRAPAEHAGVAQRRAPAL